MSHKELCEELDGPEDAIPIECPVCGKSFCRSQMNFTRDCHGITFRLVCASCWERVMAKGYDGEHYTEADECIDADY